MFLQAYLNRKEKRKMNKDEIAEKVAGHFLARTDYVGIHGHDKCETGSNEWHFHNYEHGYKHCSGGEKNPYEVKHFDKKHGISKEYARGHGRGYEPQWFHFTNSLGDGWYDLASGSKVEVEKVPESFK